VFPVILCGGSGTRLWPASRPERPKQFLPLLGELSIFQDTVLRMRRLKGARDTVIVAGQAHLEAIREQLADIGQAAFVITEPEGRDSAPAIAAAARWIESQSPGAVAVVVAADHHIPDADAFCAAADIAVAAAREGAIVAFGVRPAHPATGYGYIEPGEALASAEGARKVRRFVEKPPAETARAYVEAGYLWNSGNFVFRADRLLGELAAFAPELIARVEAACKGGEARPDGLHLGADFLSCPKISIDYAVMEKTLHAAVVPVDYSWSDLGSWQAIHEASARDELGNSLRGETAAHASRECLVRSATDQLVTVVGLDRVGVVVEPDAVLVCALDASQEVKGLVDKLKAASGASGTGPASDPLGARLRDWLVASAFPLWWSLGADHGRGGFREGLHQSGQPADELRRIRVHARQVYAYAMAGRLGWRGPWRDAILHGLGYLEARYRRPDGLYRTLITAEGEVSDDLALLYDQAFVLLALASAARAMPEDRSRLTAQASELLDRIRGAYAHPAGGFREAVEARAFQSNAHMHLFEAALSWTEVSGETRWTALADEIGELCLRSFIDPAVGALREVFDAAWRPAPGELGRILEPGHQFEWAWLLQQWAQLTGRSDAGAAAARLFEAGERGVDAARGAAVDSLFDDFSMREHTARLWPQTERLKAASILGREAVRGQAGELIEAYLAVPIPGLWRDRLDPDGRFAEGPAPASSLYHLVAAIAELNGIRIIGRTAAGGAR
jgi:mannose-1-phosphate guanylyltransferase/mannose-6-phosphate isomerase